MNILITGGAGFIGSHFVKYLLQKYKQNDRILILDKLTYAGNKKNLTDCLTDCRLTFVAGDVKDSSLVGNIFKEFNIDIVVNFAAESHVDNSIASSRIFFETNVSGMQNVLETAKKHWTIGKDEKGYPIYKERVKFLQISTDEVYGSLTREMPHPFVETSPLNPNNPYSASKASADLIIQAYHRTYRLPMNIVRLSNNYGTHQFPEKLIPLTIKQILENKPIPIYGNGQQIRDWLWVEDTCEAIELVIKKGINGEIYNVGGGNEKKNLDLVKMILSFMEKDENLISFIPDRLGHDEHYAMKTDKMTRLGWQPKISFEEGLRKTLRWQVRDLPYQKK